MFEELYVYHMRRLLHVIQRSLFYQVRFISWDEEAKIAILRRGFGHYLFQVIYASFTFPIFPVSIFQSYRVTVEEGQHDKRTILLSYAFSLTILAFLPYSWVLLRYSGTSKVIKLAKATSILDEQFTGVHHFKPYLVDYNIIF